MIAAALLAAVAILPNGSAFTLEVAADEESRARGYMFREHVGPREGMLFVFETAARHGFWMKNCRVPLDLVWLDPSRRVVQIVENAPPCPAEGPCPLLVPMRPALYVLEFAGGTSRREGLSVGDTVSILSEPARP